MSTHSNQAKPLPIETTRKVDKLLSDADRAYNKAATLSFSGKEADQWRLLERSYRAEADRLISEERFFQEGLDDQAPQAPSTEEGGQASMTQGR